MRQKLSGRSFAKARWEIVMLALLAWPLLFSKSANIAVATSITVLGSMFFEVSLLPLRLVCIDTCQQSHDTEAIEAQVARVSI